MSRIELLREGVNSLEDVYIKKDGGFKGHKTGSRIKLMPFVTNYTDACSSDFRSFQGVVGECFRISSNNSFDKKFNTDKETSFKKKLRNSIIEKALDKVETENKEELKDIIIKLFFEDDAGLIKFNNQVLPFMNFTFEHPQLNETARFFYDIFLNEEEIDLNELTSSNNGNLLYKLIIECLPELHSIKSTKTDIIYQNIFPEIKDMFLEDFKFLSSNEETFLKHIEDLFKYYYFLYFTQFTQRLCSFGDNSKFSPVYFSMDWETLSESRKAFQFGWKKLSYNLLGLFEHANTLELLNYITIDGNQLGDYVSIREKYDQLSVPEKNEFIDKVKEVSLFYTSHITVFDTGANWEQCEIELGQYLERTADKQRDELNIEIISLNKRLKYQFDNSPRKSARDKYDRWLFLFCKSNYTKTRGRLGSTTVLNQELLLFLTKLCVGGEDKIRLNLLWERLEKRGIVFDEITKTEIIKLFERINLLEKKSDSGDAQYVKTII
ncbi:DNA phosphorothioation-dependent restriction protein DptG [Putridiphycobacter roseus]|uniref:DNA phosphorothioation-dependent restriction protein DptG n=1 Tax=Putridiphycobacter roseus TaxID=2219161 RepID=A0A2W1NGB6_9FLAO|nr:DNA phosphorothioation-dependent restriction protein DptG [Putridiphycobacter roseus]PZE18143.1 DNA phosphorothioation-dependent restriction protein DptG [Putridiphycobacter roseus]